MVQKLGKGALLAKADIQSAFRLLRIWPGDFDQLGFSFSGNFYFDKCLPMGAIGSFSLFEKNCYWAAGDSVNNWFVKFRMPSCSSRSPILSTTY